MKQYLTPEQTAKLIELGFEKPKSISSIKVTGNIITTADDLIGEPSSVMGGKITANYSIGELIEMLPKIHPSYHDPYCLDIGFDTVNWVVGYTYDGGYMEVATSYELIDTLYELILYLNQEGRL